MAHLLIFLITLFLNISCGLTKHPNESNPNQNLQNAQFMIQDLEPESLGDPWIREFKLLGKDVDRWNVERQCMNEEEAWKSIGLTNAQGVFLDDDIAHANCRYRIGGGIHATQWLEIKKDLELNGELNQDSTFHANRIFIRSGQEFLIRNHTLNLKADKLLINGQLSAYKETETGHLNNAGTLKVVANMISVQGFIKLDGINGAQGNKGPSQSQMGQTGHRGSTGKYGGNGGVIELYFHEISDHAEAYSANGGKAGPGGPGGNGGARGRRRVCEPSPERGTHCYYVNIPAGRQGSPGPNGLPGRAGSIVRQQLNL